MFRIMLVSIMNSLWPSAKATFRIMTVSMLIRIITISIITFRIMIVSIINSLWHSAKATFKLTTANIMAVSITETNYQQGNPYWKGRLFTIDLLIKIASFVKKANIYFSIKKQLVWASYPKGVNRTEPFHSVRVPCLNLCNVNIFWLKQMIIYKASLRNNGGDIIALFNCCCNCSKHYWKETTSETTITATALHSVHSIVMMSVVMLSGIVL
jgi:hypothetical protein